MNPLTQYLNLYRDNRPTIEAGSSATLNNARTVAYNILQNLQLPDKNTPGYEKTPLDQIFAPDYGINITRLPIKADLNAPFRCGIPHASTLLAIIANDRFIPSSTLLANAPEGLTVTSLNQAQTSHTDILQKHYAKIAPCNDTATQLNTLLAQDGILIHLAPHTHIDKPLQLINILSSTVPTLTPRRILIVLEEDAHLTALLCDHTAPDAAKGLLSQVIEVHLARNASLHLCDIEENTTATTRLSQVWINQHDNSSLNWAGITLHNGTTRNEYHININGCNSHTQVTGMAIADQNRHIDNTSDISHNAPRSYSNQLFKYVLNDHATAAFQGSIVVTPKAPYTEAYQIDRNLLCSPHARMHTKPQLLIYNDDVKCSHGATTGQLDEKAIFYMRSRGIPLDQARQMLIQAFMNDVTDAIHNQTLRDRLRQLIEQRLQGHDTHCQDCTSTCK